MVAMNVDGVLPQSSITFSLGSSNTEEDVDYVLQDLPSMVLRLREMSPLYSRDKP